MMRRLVLRLCLAVATFGGMLACISPASHAQTRLGPPPPAAANAQAQAGKSQTQTVGPPNALQGFSQNKDQPVKILASTLEVHDKDKVAVFNGNVQLVQGDTTMRCASLVVFYEDDATKGGIPTANPGPNGQQTIRRLEAKGGVQVVQKDQTATGDNGVFDMRANTVTLIGNVTVARSQDVLRGERLVVDLTNGVSRMVSGTASGRVEGLFRSSGSGPASQDSGIVPAPKLPTPSRGN
jgi:lipopolysaccharide export system protein LptA